LAKKKPSQFIAELSDRMTYGSSDGAVLT